MQLLTDINHYEKIENDYKPWIERIEGGYFEQEDIDALKEILESMKE